MIVCRHRETVNVLEDLIQIADELVDVGEGVVEGRRRHTHHTGHANVTLQGGKRKAVNQKIIKVINQLTTMPRFWNCSWMTESGTENISDS